MLAIGCSTSLSSENSGSSFFFIGAIKDMIYLDFSLSILNLEKEKGTKRNMNFDASENFQEIKIL